MPGHVIENVQVDALKLDLDNPRFVGLELASEDDMVRYLYDQADLREMLLSILDSGYLDFEPIVVERGTNKVLEGNRRIAALRLIRDAGLRERIGIELPGVPQNLNSAKPDTVRAVLVDSAGEARRFIGFKHINGPQKWDAMSKAKYAADWHRTEGTSLEEISRALGDTFNTVTRLVDGYRVYEQAVRAGFDTDRRTARRFAFSHLYTALTRASVKQWLDIGDTLGDPPIPVDKEPQLLKLMSWLYGQGDGEPAVVRTQNPDLNRLADVMGNPRALEVLMSTRRLDMAFQEMEPPTARLESALVQAVRYTEAASAVGHSFDPASSSTFALGERLFKAARDLFKGFRDKRDRLTGLDDDL